MSIASRINEMTEHLRNDWNSINKLGLKTKKLPDEYKQVEYIESSGTQYIDTGFVPNQNTRTVIDFMPTSTSSPFIFGSRLGYNNNAYDLYTFSNKFRDDYANTNYGNESSQPFPKSANKRYLFDKNKNHSIMYEENVQFYDHTFTEKTINLSFNMFLFGLNDNGSIRSSNIAMMKLYSCKIYDNGILVRDFVPCYRIDDDEVGLYDTVNDIFYTNQGTGVFTYGETQEEIPNKNIKNIAPVLDRFYNKSSDKTDLSENGIVGRTSQESTTGKNLFDKSLITSIGGTIKYIPINVKKNTDYTLSTNSGTSTLANVFLSTTNSGVTTNNNGAMIDQPRTINSSDNNIMYVGYRNDLSSYWIQLEESSTATSYEPYTGGEPSPSPDYPQEVNNLSGDVEYKVRGKNLFDISNNSKSIHSTIETSGNIISGDTLRITNIAEGAYRYYFIPLTNVEFVLGKTITLSVKASLYGATSGQIRFMWASNTWYTTALGNPTNFTSNGTYTCTVEVPSDIPSGSTRLCAGLYSSGTTSSPINSYVDYSDIQVEVGLTSTPYEPYISESFPLSLKSRNLFDKDNANVISAYISGSRKISEMAVDKLIYIPCKPNTIYSLQKMSQETANYNRFRIGTTTDMPALRMTVEDYFNAGDGSTLTNKTITTGANANYLVFYCYREDPLTTFEDMLSSIQIEEGSTPSDYEPYYDINLCNISDYKDRIYSQNGKFYLEKKTVKVVLDGSETYRTFSNNRFRTQNTNKARNGFDTIISICNILTATTQSSTVSTTQNNLIAVNEDYIWLRITSSTTEEELKTLLQNTNAIIYYILATPTTTEITQENYPTLYSQLLAIQEFLTKYKINNEFLLDYSSPEIEY